MEWHITFLTQPTDLLHAYTSSYNFWLVVLSVLVAVFASITAFQIVSRLSKSAHGKGWTLMAALMLGMGVWAMHFIGMTAFRINCGIAYEPWLTGLSMLPAIFAAAVALSVISQEKVEQGRLIFSGVVIGGGIGLMHYAGMAAIRMDGILRYDLTMFVISLVTAVTLAIPALGMKFIIARFRWGRLPHVASLLGGTVMGGAISSMHYIAMKAAYFIHVDGVAPVTGASPQVLAMIVGALVVLLLVIGLMFMLMGSHIVTVRNRMESILAITWQGFVMLDEDGTIMDSNQAMLGLVGLEGQSIIGRNILEFTDESSILQGRFHAELNLRRANGASVPCLVNGSKILEADGRIQYSFALFSDLTEIKQAEQIILNASREKLLILDSTVEGIYGIDMSGRCTFSNKAAARMLGYEISEMLGKNTHELIHHHRKDGSAYPVNQCTIYNAFRSGQPCFNDDEVFWRKDHTSFPVEYSSSPIMDAGRITGAVITFSDITDRKRMEVEQILLQAQLQQAQKMEAIGQLTGGIAHDFNNLLAAILGYTDLALDRFVPDKDSKLASYLREVHTAGVRARDLIAKMLAFSRGAKGEPVSMDAAPLVKEVVKTLHSVIPSSIEIKAKVDGQIPAILSDPVQLHQVMMNLAINARDAIGEHGCIEIELHQSGHVEAKCDSCNKDFEGEYVALTVSDSGHGIPPHILNRIFEPFFTTKDVGKGTGMGLSMVHGIMHEHGGHIRVRSEPGKGTTFSLLFPIASEDRPIEDNTSQIEASKYALVPGSILVVDDEATVSRMLGEVLVEHGHRATVMTDSSKALAPI